MAQLVTDTRPFDPREILGGQSLRATYSDAFSSTFLSSFDRNITSSIGRGIEQTYYQQDGSKVLSAEDANAKYGLGGALKFEKDTNESEAKFKYDLKLKEIKYNRALNNVQTGIVGEAGLFAAGIGGSALDPAAWVAGAYLAPAVLGLKGLQALKAVQAVKAARIARGVKTGLFAGNAIGKSIALGATEGFIGNTALEPIIYAQAQREGADYTAGNSLMNIAFGTGFGAIARPLGTAFSHFHTKLRLKGHTENFNLALAQVLDNKKVDLTSSFKSEFNSAIEKTIKERELLSTLSDKHILDSSNVYVKNDGGGQFRAQFPDEKGALEGIRAYGASKDEAIKALQDKYNNILSHGIDPLGVRKFDSGLPTPQVIANVEAKVQQLKSEISDLSKPTVVKEKVKVVSEKQGADYKTANKISETIKSLDETAIDLQKRLKARGKETKLTGAERADVKEQLSNIKEEKKVLQAKLGEHTSKIKDIESRNTIDIKNEKLRKKIELLNLEHDLRNMKRDVAELPANKAKELKDKFSTEASNNIVFDGVEAKDIKDHISYDDIEALKTDIEDEGVIDIVKNLDLIVERTDGVGDVRQEKVTLESLDNRIEQAKTVREKINDYVNCRLGK